MQLPPIKLDGAITYYVLKLERGRPAEAALLNAEDT